MEEGTSARFESPAVCVDNQEANGAFGAVRALGLGENRGNRLCVELSDMLDTGPSYPF